jgi:hypothetical protein
MAGPCRFLPRHARRSFVFSPHDARRSFIFSPRDARLGIFQ